MVLPSTGGNVYNRFIERFNTWRQSLLAVVVGFRCSTGLTDLGGIDSDYIAFEGWRRCDRLLNFYRYS